MLQGLLLFCRCLAGVNHLEENLVCAVTVRGNIVYSSMVKWCLTNESNEQLKANWNCP